MFYSLHSRPLQDSLLCIDGSLRRAFLIPRRILLVQLSRSITRLSLNLTAKRADGSGEAETVLECQIYREEPWKTVTECGEEARIRRLRIGHSHRDYGG
jgi:hypothetical protein